MAVATKHVLVQGPVLGTLARTALQALRRREGGQALPPTPGPELRRRIPPLPADLVRDYIRHVGGDPAAYAGRVPHHLFPQWTFPIAARTLADVPQPLHKIINAGCRLEFRGPLPVGEALLATAQLQSIEDDGHALRMQQRITTSSSTHVHALVADLFSQVTYARPAANEGARPRRPRPRVPVEAREIARWSLRTTAGLDFAKLTGDFNPIHWVPSYARMAGFRNTILHGFSTLARTIESLQRNAFAGSTHALAAIDVRFRAPLVLPARVGVFLAGDDEVFVGDAPGGPAYLTGRYELRARGEIDE